MSKILYIDDELDGVKIINLFGKYLTESEESELSTALQSDIPTILANNIYLQAEYDFVKVLELLENDFEKFNFFIIDRNLKGNNEHPVYDVGTAEKMALPNRRIEPEREGDYIFIVLLEKYCKYSNPAILFDNFFFLTAYKDTELAYKELRVVNSDNIINKSYEEIKALAENIINKFEDLVIKSEHREVFEVFNKRYLDNNHELSLISLLKNQNLKNSTEISGQISILRNMFQEILERVVGVLKKCENIKELEKTIPEDFGEKDNPNKNEKDNPNKNEKNNPNKNEKKRGKFKSYIIGILNSESQGNLEIPKILTFLNGIYAGKAKTTQYFTHSNYLLGSVYSGSIYDIINKFWKVCSENQHGGTSAPRPNKYKPSRYTLPILTNIMMDFLLWYGDFMDKYSKPTP